MLKAFQPAKQAQPSLPFYLLSVTDPLAAATHRACLSLFRNKIEQFQTRHLNSAISLKISSPSALSSLLRDRLMGKSPLRLVLARAEIHRGAWRESLACGHEIITFTNFLWDESGHLINIPPNAMRRRCQECKEIAQGLGDRVGHASSSQPHGAGDGALVPQATPKPVQSVTRKRRAA